VDPTPPAAPAGPGRRPVDGADAAARRRAGGPARGPDPPGGPGHRPVPGGAGPAGGQARGPPGRRRLVDRGRQPAGHRRQPRVRPGRGPRPGPVPLPRGPPL
ncbi:MAG: Signal peptidase, partial [uncultured Corynebacteriales bacterium]